MIKRDFHHHWIMDYHSTLVAELPEGDNVIGVYKKKYWEATSRTLGREGEQLKPSSKVFAIVLLRKRLPNFFGEGITKDEAVDSLLDKLVQIVDNPQELNVDYG